MAERLPRVLFLCTGNACRSQIAEGWARALHGDRLVALSAGTHPKGLDPRAVRVMAEVGVDLASQRSKALAEIDLATVDLVITVCGAADASCPTPPRGTRREHVPFDDPPALAAGAPDEEAALAHYRRVRDEIRAFVETLPARFA
jgi:arsenate reductase